MIKLNAKELVKKLEKEGYTNIRVCHLPPNIDAPEHTHDQHTVHIILSSGLDISDNSGTWTYHPGDRVEFPAGTTHKAKGLSKHGEMIVGVKNKMNPVVHFEMPYENRQRMVDFYARTFGWQVEMLGPEMGSYAVVNTSERDPQTHFPKETGRINGGFFQKTKDTQYPSVVIAVDNIREHMKKVENAGGKILEGQKPGEPDEIPNVGLYASFIDTEGNMVSMIQPFPR